jgi:hypothetical protein
MENKLVLTHWWGETLSYTSKAEGSAVLTGALGLFIEDSGKLQDERTSLLTGVNFHNKEVKFAVVDEYGENNSGELVRFRSRFTIVPRRHSTMDFGTTSGNILFLAKLLRNNCFKIKRRLNVMREIVDEAQNNDLDIPDYIYNMYINCEKLYYAMQGEIGFLANTVVAAII